MNEQLKDFLGKQWDWLKAKFALLWVRVRRIWKKYHLTKLIILLALSFVLLLSVFFTVQARRVNIAALRAGIANPTIVYDDESEIAGSLYSQKGTFTSIEEISPTVQEAIIATEDQRFMTHRGFDPIGIGRAAFGYIVQGGIVGGGSTVTQQLTKNAYLSADQTVTRKLKELFLAIEIEKSYKKEEILEMYLNNSYFGNGVWGVQDASKKYFNKNASELSLSEGATLAGMLKAPTNYNPIDNYERSINRRNLVLKLMKDTEKITEEEQTMATALELTLSDGYNRSEDYRYPYYFDAVVSEAINRYNFREQDILNGGYKIYTGLNQNQQQQMDRIYAIDSLFERPVGEVQAQSASIAIEPATGGVKAVVGGRGNYTIHGYNYATQMRRQPGSVIKPLSVFAPALEAGYEITDSVVDEQASYGEGDEAYSPSNIDHTYSGEMPMYQALAESKNAAAVWLLDDIGIKRGYNKLKQFGVRVDETDNHYGAIALGGMAYGTSPLEIASAYSVFANNGVRMEPHFITKIVDPTGAIVVDNTKPKKRRVLSQRVNEDMNIMLLNVFSDGLGQNIQPSGFKVAGKTGTTQTEAGKGAKDQWVVAYTPDIVIASWQGYDKTDAEHYLTSSTIQGVGQVLKAEFEAIQPYTQQTTFLVEDNELETAVKEKQFEERLENLKDDLKKGEEVLRKATKKAGEEAEKAAREAKKLFDKLRDRR